jgi:hypothetical protein
MTAKTLVMVMVDGLRHDYVTDEDAPFLSALARDHARGSLVPPFGFEPDGAYLSGLDPEECDGGAQYWRNPAEQVFHLTPLFNLLEVVPACWWHRIVRRAARLIAQVFARDPMTRKMAPTNQIPWRFLPRFSFPMKRFACDPGFTPTPTIFDAVRLADGEFFFHGHPAYKVGIDQVVDRYLREEHGGNALAFLFVGDLDGIGHRFGPGSPQRRAALRRVDESLGRIYAHARANYGAVDLLVFGDHGMVDVTGTVDLRAAIVDAGLLASEDTWFLDSTFARFWVADSPRRAGLVTRLGQEACGHVLDDSETEQYRIRYPHNHFGDVIFALNDGKLVHPSFYSVDAQPPKGMHGYLPGCRDNESAFVLVSSRTRARGDVGRVDMRRLFPTTLDLLGLAGTVPIPHASTSIVT